MSRSKNKFKKILLYSLVTFLLCYFLVFAIDRMIGRYKNAHRESKAISISRGDIIFRVTFYGIADSKYANYGSAPGHLGIFLSDTTITDPTVATLKKLLVAETSLFNHKGHQIKPILRINSADNNYAHAFGRLILIKTHLSNSQKNVLQKYAEMNVGKPYKLFAEKSDTSFFNCSSFVWNALKHSAKIDADANGGDLVLPFDILSYFLTKDNVEIVTF